MSSQLPNEVAHTTERVDVTEIPQSLYAFLARLRSESKRAHDTAYDEFDDGVGAGLNQSIRLLVAYIESHGGKGTT